MDPVIIFGYFGLPLIAVVLGAVAVYASGRSARRLDAFIGPRGGSKKDHGAPRLARRVPHAMVSTNATDDHL